MKVNIGRYKDNGKERKVDIHIDKWDSWNADHTLALIILPVLKQLKETKQGAPFVADEDVPENIRSTSAAPKENKWDTDEHWFARWNYVLDCMIFSFGEIVDNTWEDKFYTYSEGFNDSLEWEEMRKHFHIDREGLEKHDALIQQGLNLFAKYYRNLWD